MFLGSVLLSLLQASSASLLCSNDIVAFVSERNPVFYDIVGQCHTQKTEDAFFQTTENKGCGKAGCLWWSCSQDNPSCPCCVLTKDQRNKLQSASMKTESGHVVQFQIAEMAKLQSQNKKQTEAEMNKKNAADAQVSKLKAQVAKEDKELHHDGQQEQEEKMEMEQTTSAQIDQVANLKEQVASEKHQLQNLGRQNQQQSAQMSELKSQITSDDCAILGGQGRLRVHCLRQRPSSLPFVLLVCALFLLVFVSAAIVTLKNKDKDALAGLRKQLLAAWVEIREQLIKAWVAFRERLFPALTELRERLLPEGNSEVPGVFEAVAADEAEKNQHVKQHGNEAERAADITMVVAADTATTVKSQEAGAESHCTLQEAGVESDSDDSAIIVNSAKVF